MTAGLLRGIRRATRLGLLAASLGAAVWGLSQSPFAAPLVDRSAHDAARSLEAAFHRTFTPGWLEAALDRALAQGDAARVLWLADLAAAEGMDLPPGQAVAVAELRARADSWTAAALDCGACAWDIRSCVSLGMMAACALPVELSPLGDVNALRRQGLAALEGQAVDRIETGLALAGLAATAAVAVSGGASAPIKAGTAAVRMARRLDSLTPGFSRVLGDAADLPVNWGAVLRAAPLDEITDTARLARLGAIAGDLGRIATNAGPAEALVLLRHVETAEDAARLARLSDVAGARTLSRVEVLGPARAVRATLRLSDLALGTLAALWASVTQLGVALAGWLARALLR